MPHQPNNAEDDDEDGTKSSSLTGVTGTTTQTSETTSTISYLHRKAPPPKNESIIITSTNKLLPNSSKNENSTTSHNLSFLTLPEVDDDDGSQAWCIVICCFIVNIVVMGFLKCLGILIIEVQKSYKASPADVSVLVSIISFLNCIAGPLACYLVMKFTARTIAFFGTILVTLGLMLSWFATSITFLYFSIGVLIGLGSGFTYSPGLILIGNYFQKNRGMANGVVVSGSPVGGMIMPYMLNFLIRYLDCRGTFLILGGLMMNAVICTLSYKPYRPSSRSKKGVKTSKEALLQARRTDAFHTLHIPDDDGDSSSASSVTVLQQKELQDNEDFSDESSGPEFMVDEDAGFRRSQNKIKKKSSGVSSTGSVIVYKINEKYGQRRHKNHDNKFSGKPHPVYSKPLFWTKEVHNEHDAKHGKFRKLSGTGQNIESKMSQTVIHPKYNDRNETIIHPFSKRVRRAKGSGGGGTGLVSSSGKVASASSPSPPTVTASSNKGHTTTIPPPTNTVVPQTYTASPTKLNPIVLQSGSLAQSQIGSQTMGSQESGVSSGIRNRKVAGSIKDQQQQPQDNKRKEQASPASTTKKLPPYILSLDHSCVIMWSNDNLTKGQVVGPRGKPASSAATVTKLFEGGGDLGGSSDAGGGSHIDHDIVATPAGVFVGIKPMEKKKSCCFRCINWIKHSPLAYPTYLILLFSNSTTAIATTNVLLLIPALGEHRGLSKAEASTVYLIISLSDLCSRLCGSFIYDRKYLSPKLIFASGLLFAGISSFFIGVSDSFLKFCCFGGLFGFSSGLHIGIFGALLAEVVGIPLLPIGYAFCMILNGILQFSFINISGKILSSDPEAYTNLYSFYGTALVFGGSLWLIPFLGGWFHKLHSHFLHKKNYPSSNKDNNPSSNTEDDDNKRRLLGSEEIIVEKNDKKNNKGIATGIIIADTKSKSQSDDAVAGKSNPVKVAGMSNISLF